jgi:acyl-CoA synthetase (AMP-forming)/AMP-acid ligase II
MILSSPHQPITMDDSTVPAMLDRAATTHPDRVALVDGPTGASVTYAELARRVARIAGWMDASGLRTGDRVATWAPNVPPVAAVTIAALRLGATVSGISPAATEPEAAGQVRELGASLVVTVPSLVPAASGFGARCVVALGESAEATALTELLAYDRPSPADRSTPEMVALLPYSSGTTGRPKPVMLTHRQLVTATRQVARAIEATDRDVTLAVAPWFHILGMTAELLVPLSVGATIVTLPRFEADALLDLLERHHVTYLAVPPPIAALLATHPSVPGRHLERLELVAVGGAPLSAHTQLALQQRLPQCAIGQGWGLTETSGALCVPGRGGAAPGTVGVPLPQTELRVVDPADGTTLPPGAEGELQARGPQLMAGYLDLRTETQKIFTADGWLHTGDLGRFDEHGNVVITGRLKELIKVNALQVAPAELEDVLLQHEAVADAAVVGIPDERTGERPLGIVVASREVSEGELLGWVARRVAPYKRLAGIRFIDELPRTPSGKLLRRSLVVSGAGDPSASQPPASQPTVSESTSSPNSTDRPVRPASVNVTARSPAR